MKQLLFIFLYFKTRMSKIGFHPHLKMNTLPFVDLPNSDYPSFFYKTKYRINPDRMVTLLGLKLHVMSRY